MMFVFSIVLMSKFLSTIRYDGIKQNKIYYAADSNPFIVSNKITIITKQTKWIKYTNSENETNTMKFSEFWKKYSLLKTTKD